MQLRFPQDLQNKNRRGKNIFVYFVNEMTYAYGEKSKPRTQKQGNYDRNVKIGTHN